MSPQVQAGRLAGTMSARESEGAQATPTMGYAAQVERRATRLDRLNASQAVQGEPAMSG